jgi:hypothetical protein
MAHKLPFQILLSEQKGPKQVPWIIFVRLKAIFSKTAVKMASKSIKNLVQKIYFYRPHRKILLFRIFLLLLPLFRDAPQSPLEFSNFWLVEIQANTQTNNPQKTELWYLQNSIFYKFINIGGTYVPSRH